MTERAQSPLLKCALDAMEEVFLAFTAEGENIRYWNRSLKERTGYTDEELEGKLLTELVAPEDNRQIERFGEKVLDEGSSQLESLLHTKEGETLPYVFTALPVEQDDTQMICLTGQDTRRRGKASEEWYRRLFEEAQEGIVITTPDGTIIEANPAAKAIFGYRNEELPTSRTADFYADPDEQEKVLEALRREGAISSREISFQRADGEEIHCELSVTVLYGEEGEPEANLTFFRNVTERKRAEEALKESEEKFRKLAEGALVGITLIQDGIFKYVNPMMSRITGYSQEELVGESPKISTHPEDWPHVHKQIRRRIEGTAQEVRYATRLKTKSGETRIVEVSGTRISYQGEPAVIATAQDVTEQRRLRREILQIQEAERKRIGQDLHDSVASQLTGVNLMLGNLSKRPEARKIADDIKDAQKLVQESAREMRRLSRGLSPGGLSAGDLHSALQGLAKNVGRARFTFNTVGRGIAASDLGEEVATHLYRIAQEAVANARKYTEDANIVIRLIEEDTALHVEVEDDGMGFDPDEKSEGLGLRSMRHRAGLLGAELTVESSPGDGTLVRCSLPR